MNQLNHSAIVLYGLKSKMLPALLNLPQIRHLQTCFTDTCSHCRINYSNGNTNVRSSLVSTNRVHNSIQAHKSMACVNELNCSKCLHTSPGLSNALQQDGVSTSDNKPASKESKKSASEPTVEGTVPEDSDIKPALMAHTPINDRPKFVNIVPGKGPPPEPPVDCCMSGCANCVWIQYAEEMKDYFDGEQGKEITKAAIDKIENPSLQMFLKLELGLL